jgi:hypothetical protein
MSCGSEFYTSNCVCDTLLAIVEAQDKVGPAGCTNGCSSAIQQLVGGVVTGPNDTIPVILYCKSTCAPFEGFGAVPGPAGTIDIVSGCLFRVEDVDPETCCAQLRIIESPANPTGADGLLCVEALDGTAVAALDLTDACITVDLNCFCAVTCVFPIDLL